MAVRPVLAFVLCAAALAACGATAGAEPAGASCQQFAASATIDESRSVAVGGDLTISLCSNASTGFAWGEPQVADPAVLQVAGRTYQESAGASTGVVGAAGTEVLTVHGLSAGTTTLTISYGQPWPGGAQDTWQYRLTVTVG